MRRRANEMDSPGLLQFDDDEQRVVRDEGAEGPDFCCEGRRLRCRPIQMRLWAATGSRKELGETPLWRPACRRRGPIAYRGVGRRSAAIGARRFWPESAASDADQLSGFGGERRESTDSGLIAARPARRGVPDITVLI